MNIGDAGLTLIKGFEQFRSDAYLDAVGIPTIGYGTTHIDGQPVKMGTKCTEAQASAWLRSDLDRFEDDIQNALNVPVTQAQFDALCSLVYNIGPTNFKKSSVLSCLNNGDIKTAQARFLLWNKAGGKTLKGLTRRRLAEAVMFGPLSREELIDTFNLDV